MIKIGLRLIAAGILLQTLYFKFTGAPESVYIFSAVGAEPYGRWMTGVFELVASLLLLIPRTQTFGALLGLGLMAGALLTHVFVIGLLVQDDGGTLFALACVTFVSCAAIVFMNRDQLFSWLEGVRRA